MPENNKHSTEQPRSGGPCNNTNAHTCTATYFDGWQNTYHLEEYTFPLNQHHSCCKSLHPLQHNGPLPGSFSRRCINRWFNTIPDVAIP